MTELGSDSKFPLIFSAEVFLTICTTVECESRAGAHRGVG